MEKTTRTWHIDTLIRAVAGDLPPESMESMRREMRADKAALALLGIEIDGDTVTHKPLNFPIREIEPGVWVTVN